jgi:hypothetical protein
LSRRQLTTADQSPKNFQALLNTAPIEGTRSKVWAKIYAIETLSVIIGKLPLL